MEIPPLKQRLTSRKFWLTALGVIGVISQIATGSVSIEHGLSAIAAIITGYNIGNGLQKR